MFIEMMFIELMIDGEPQGRYLTYGYGGLWEWGSLEDAILFSPNSTVDVASDWRYVKADTSLQVL